MNDIPTPSVMPDQDSTQALQNRLRELRSGLPPEQGQKEAKLRKACQDFEAVFISQIWKQMRSSVPKEGMLHSKEEESYLSMFDQELSVKMAGSGGIGLSDMLYANLSERLVNASKDTSAAKPLKPLDRSDMPAARAEAPQGFAQTRTLAALTAQHEAEMLARRIEQEHVPGRSGAGRAGEATPSDLEDALRVVSMDETGER